MIKDNFKFETRDQNFRHIINDSNRSFPWQAIWKLEGDWRTFLHPTGYSTRMWTPQNWTLTTSGRHHLIKDFLSPALSFFSISLASRITTDSAPFCPSFLLGLSGTDWHGHTTDKDLPHRTLWRWQTDALLLLAVVFLFTYALLLARTGLLLTYLLPIVPPSSLPPLPPLPLPWRLAYTDWLDLLTHHSYITFTHLVSPHTTPRLHR